MVIKSTNVTVYFERIDNIKAAIVNNEKFFSSCFCPPTVLPVPDQLPDDAPRVIMQSVGGHSQLQFSKFFASLVTFYDGEYENDFQKCISNLTEKFNCISNFLLNEKVELLYMGFITTVLMNKTGTDVINMLNDKMNKITTNIPLYDYSNKLTFVVENDYFANISFSNVRLFSSNNQYPQQSPLTPGLALDDAEQDVEVIIDINDRHAHNINKDYRSEQSKFDFITNLSSKALNDVCNFFNTGVLGENE